MQTASGEDHLADLLIVLIIKTELAIQHPYCLLQKRCYIEFIKSSEICELDDADENLIFDIRKRNFR